VHLVGDADGLYRFQVGPLPQVRRGDLGVFPPRVGVLFGPAGLVGNHAHFGRRRTGRRHQLTRICVEQRSLNERTANVVAEEVHGKLMVIGTVVIGQSATTTHAHPMTTVPMTNVRKAPKLPNYGGKSNPIFARL
jgi:hypothetical protein